MNNKSLRVIFTVFLTSLVLCSYAGNKDKKTEVGPYTVDIICDNVYHIQDCNSKNPSGETFNEQGEKTHFNNCSDMYLLVGKDNALLIDLSNYITWDNTAIKSLRKIVDKRTKGKALTITFTHNHGDHTGMLPAFVDDKAVRFALPRIDFEGMKDKFPDVQYSFYDEGHSFDLGGMKVNTLLVPGHTHGSMVFFLEGRNMVFTGDAIGSGHGVWIFNTEGFREYADALPKFVKYIEDTANGIDTDKLQIWGGHYWQKDWFEKTANKDVDWKYVKDMEVLVNQVKGGTAKHEPSNLNVRNLDTYFRNNNAIIVWNLKEAEDFAKSQAKPRFPRMMPQKAPAENYELKACDGHATMVIDAANGARIMSLKWDDEEVLSQNPAPNMYGSTFWTSPQKEWNWPPVREHDMGKYSVEETDGKIIMTGSVPERIPLRISKTFSVVDGNKFCITYAITNEGTEDRKVAPWEVTRVPGEGEIAFNAQTGSIWPAGLMNFVQDGKRAVYNIDKVDKQRKINANGSAGQPGGTCDGMSIMTYKNKNLTLTKRFPDLKDGEAAPGEDEIQVYVHQDALYCEIEEQGAYTLLHPGERLEWTVYWQLCPNE